MLHVKFNYYNPALKIVFNDWKEVYLLKDKPVLLKPSIHRSALTYRVPKTGKRISYKKIKQGLIKQPTTVKFELLPGVDKINWV